ncbi:MAG: NADH-quinone oxidoreductase subunit N [Rhodothermales bacterium]
MGADLASSLSLVLLSLGALVAVVWDAFRPRDRSLPWFVALILAIAAAIDLPSIGHDTTTAFYGLIHVGGVASFVKALVIGATLLSVVLSIPYLERTRHNIGEVYALILFATVGMIVLGTANNLIAIFVGLETMSICLYVMAGLIREDEGGNESALKYFILGAFSTGFFLYGIALLYGATGTMYLNEIASAVRNGGGVMFWGGLSLLLIGFLFKVSAVPFHMWTPDVYQGAPTTLTGYMSTASKTAAFASLVLVLVNIVPDVRWSDALAVIAAITMVAGNLLALVQSNVKRMLAYSSIAHAGYVLVGLSAGSAAGYSGALYYMLIYTLMNIGAFGVMSVLEWDGVTGRNQSLDSLAGVGYRKPLLGVTMGLFMFSLTGFPPLGGFLGKYAVFAPAIESGRTWLVILGLLASAASAYYYLRVLYVFWMKKADDTADAAVAARTSFVVPAPTAAVLVACAIALLLLGVYPAAMDITSSFFSDGGSLAFLP